MEIFNLDKFLKYLVMKNEDMGLEKKLDLIREINYPNLTGIQSLKVIEGIVNYGVVIDMDTVLELPSVDCILLNTGIEILLNHYMELTEEEFKESIDLLIQIDIDKKESGFKKEAKDISDRGVVDILQDYVMESRTRNKNIGKNEISLYSIKVDYKDRDMIREFSYGREIFS